jgi:hypothetical protein
MNKDDTTEVVRMYSARQQADFGRMLLEGSGILSHIRADDAGGMRPYMAAATGVRLVVLTQDLERANDILSEAEENNAEQDL